MPSLLVLIQMNPTGYFKNANLKKLLGDLQAEFKNLQEIFSLLGVFMPFPFTDRFIEVTEERKKTGSKRKHSDSTQRFEV